MRVSATDAIVQFRSALESRDILPPHNLIGDGKLHRCDAKARGGKGDAAYILHLDGLPAGGFENHRDGIGWETWRADLGRLLTPTEEEEGRRRIAAARAEREADDKRRKDEAAGRAERLWQGATGDCAGHPYLLHKKVEPHDLRQYRGKLVVPARDVDGGLHTLQFIGADGSKRFLTGGRTSGRFHLIGEIGKLVCIAEGYATGATAHQATGHTVAVAFDCGNLPTVARAIRERYPDAIIILVADDDHRRAGNPGLTKAREAAAAVAGFVAVPDFGPNRSPTDTDMNDLAAAAGLDTVAKCIEAAIRTGPVTEKPAETARAAEARPSQRDKLLDGRGQVPVLEMHRGHRARHAPDRRAA